LKPRLIIIFLLIVFLPLGILGWLGYRVADNEQEIIEVRFNKLLTDKLKNIDAAILNLIDERERRLLSDISLEYKSTSEFREIVRKNSLVSQIFVLDPRGYLIHPPLNGAIKQEEADFIERTRKIWENREILYQGIVESDSRKVNIQSNYSPSQAGNTTQQSIPPRQKVNLKQISESSYKQSQSRPMEKYYGWYVWYWEKGLSIIFWHKNADGLTVGAELNMIRLMADIINILPETDPANPQMPEGRISMIDSNDKTIYKWGGYEPEENEPPRVSLTLSYPLSSWKLDYFLSEKEYKMQFGSGLMLNLLAGLLAVAIALIGLSIYFYRESSREIQEAGQRVNFVNQVSHELKTPLTNIRLYAELLENEIDEKNQKAESHLNIIVSESRRLSRLIANVLSFARKHRDKLQIRRSPGVIDEIISETLEYYRPALAQNDVKIDFTGGADALVRIDADALGQILGNLINNVEKYATSGGSLTVTSQQNGEQTIIHVKDNGPGIPMNLKDKIFEQFYRISDKLTDGVAGTGIGLPIARDLARLLGGDITLEPTETGAEFKITLNTPRE
jgi:signal transduction histidine kinase